MYSSSWLIVALSTLSSCLATPLAMGRRTVTSLSTAQFSSFAPYTQFARAAYCDGFQDWTCGAACDANADFEVSLAGGDDSDIQNYFVGFSPSLSSIIVAHEGTDPDSNNHIVLSLGAGTDPLQLESDLTDVEVLLASLDTSLFPGISSSVQVHDGFKNEHAKTASVILAEVRTLMASKNTQNVMAVGHSLGGALAELDVLFFALNLPSGSNISAVTYGTPRVGNPAFASLIDQHVPSFKHINNEKDLIPIVPGRFLGYAHPAGEIHIISPGNVVLCSGDDDATDSQCIIDTVPNIFEGDILNHLGPYDGISIGTLAC
ncbi:MAG: Alpha/Beta hydrolase protein [Lentinula lateritia]|uniref:Alpha/beta-hydrolase n=1 Tax=Lentinula lateritia TaxID=40482 RepID=A0ABQ8VP79_9AGAR|nr:MAG: Alpha/Beta hydrolase protein [Lentinula lateritia]KAJ4498091.1 alpha/beta-hydrolase [Lentinula lateritia]